MRKDLSPKKSKSKGEGRGEALRWRMRPRAQSETLLNQGSGEFETSQVVRASSLAQRLKTDNGIFWLCSLRRTEQEVFWIYVGFSAKCLMSVHLLQILALQSREWKIIPSGLFPSPKALPAGSLKLSQNLGSSASLISPLPNSGFLPPPLISPQCWYSHSSVCSPKLREIKRFFTGQNRGSAALIWGEISLRKAAGSPWFIITQLV